MTKSLNITGNVKLLDGSTTISETALAISENYSEITVQEIEIAISATDTAINFGGIASDASLVILLPTYATTGTPSEYLTVKVNSAAAGIPFGQFFVTGGKGANGTDALSVSNPDGTNTVSLQVWICK